MLSMEMKAAGMYVSRGLSYQEAEVICKPWNNGWASPVKECTFCIVFSF